MQLHGMQLVFGVAMIAHVHAWDGPYNVKTKSTWGYKGPCGPGTIYYPDSTGNFILLSFAHGMGASGTKLTYEWTLKTVASWGYIIVALEGCDVSLNEYKGQEQIMDWMFDNWDTIDHTHPGGIFGHSQGGASTVSTAHDGNGCVHYGLHGAVMMHPGIQMGMGAPWIPSLYTSGTLDVVVGEIPNECFAAAGANNVDRGFGAYNGYTHFNPCGVWSNKEAKDIANWFGCYLYYNQDACGSIWGSFCNGDKAAKSCKLIKGSGGQLMSNISGADAWEAAVRTGDPLKALAVPWGHHNQTFDAHMEEIRRRGDWVVEKRRNRLQRRWANMTRDLTIV